MVLVAPTRDVVVATHRQQRNGLGVPSSCAPCPTASRYGTRDFPGRRSGRVRGCGAAEAPSGLHITQLAFTPDGRRVVGTTQHSRVNVWRAHDAIVTVSGSGRYFDVVGKGEPWALDNMAVCRIGPVSLPLEVCAERTRVPRLGAKLMSVGEAGIEP